MRIILISLGSLFVSLFIFLTIKFWGKSLTYSDYSHPIYASESQNLQQPLIFIKPKTENILNTIQAQTNLFLDVYSTEDGRLVIPKRVWSAKEKPIRYSKLQEINDQVILVSDLKDILASKKIIFNIVENAQAGHIIFVEEIKKAGLEKGQNFIVTSPYEAMAKSLKDIAPTYLYGSTQPEILKLLAMKSMHLIEAVNLRADLIIHPLTIRNQKFFDEELIQEMAHRHKRVIIGPIDSSQQTEAESLKPFGIILNQNE